MEWRTQDGDKDSSEEDLLLSNCIAFFHVSEHIDHFKTIQIPQ